MLIRRKLKTTKPRAAAEVQSTERGEESCGENQRNFGRQQQWSCGQNQRKNEMREAGGGEQRERSRGNGETKNFRDLSCFICFNL